MNRRQGLGGDSTDGVLSKRGLLERIPLLKCKTRSSYPVALGTRPQAPVGAGRGKGWEWSQRALGAALYHGPDAGYPGVFTWCKLTGCARMI